MSAGDLTVGASHRRQLAEEDGGWGARVWREIVLAKRKLKLARSGTRAISPPARRRRRILARAAPPHAAAAVSCVMGRKAGNGPEV